MTGPHMLAKVAYDEHYGDIAKMMSDFGKLLRLQFRRCWPTPAASTSSSTSRFSRCPSTPRSIAAVDAINHGDRGFARRHPCTSTHICQGNYAVGKEYDAQIGHRYFDIGRYKADSCLQDRMLPLISIEHDMTHHYERPAAQPAARRRRGGCAGSQSRNRRDRRGTDRKIRMACAGTDHHHKLLRLQPPAAQYRRRQAASDDRSQAHSRRLDRERHTGPHSVRQRKRRASGSGRADRPHRRDRLGRASRHRPIVAICPGNVRHR